MSLLDSTPTALTPRDPRAAHSRAALKTAAFELCQERRIEDISVKDIVARAQVSRQVFYNHFADRDMALKTSIVESLDATLVGLEPQDAPGLFVRLLSWSADYPHLYENLFPSRVAQALIEHTKDLLRPMCAQRVLSLKADLTLGEQHLLTTFYVSGIIGVLWNRQTQDGDLNLTAQDCINLFSQLSDYPWSRP